MSKSKIEWTENSRSVVAGCEPVGPECLHCYAARMQGTRHRHLPIHGLEMYRGDLVTCKSAGKAGGNRYVFNGVGGLDVAALVASLGKSALPSGVCFWNHTSDTFWEVLGDDEVAAQLAVLASRKDVRALVLTKRAGRMRQFFEAMAAPPFNNGDPWHPGTSQAIWDLAASILPPKARATVETRWPMDSPWPPQNIALGVSVGTRKALHRIDDLRATPAAMRFLSLEPLLEDLGPLNLEGIDWVIVGAESGPGARPAELDWFRSIRDQCEESGVPFFLKQHGACNECLGYCGDESGPCRACGGSGLGKVRKGNPAIDGQVHDARPAWLTGGAR